jgi:GH15 family glucan-1,4-alpha-glucosidase
VYLYNKHGTPIFTYSTLMCWVAVERALRIANQRGVPAHRARWGSTRERIYREIMHRGWHQHRAAFVQHFDTSVLDASVLLMPLVKSSPRPTRAGCPPSRRSRTSASPTVSSTATTPRPPPTVSPATRAPSRSVPCWYVEALARAGFLGEARLVLEKMFTYANHLGL